MWTAFASIDQTTLCVMLLTPVVHLIEDVVWMLDGEIGTLRVGCVKWGG